MNGGQHTDEALALIELGGIARSVTVLDAMAKRAAFRVLQSEAVSPGKFLILICGRSAEIVEAHAAATLIAGTALLDQLLLCDAHQQVVPMARGEVVGLPADAGVAVCEFSTVASCLAALDTVLKGTGVQVHKLHAAKGIGGRAYFVLSGELGELQIAHELCQRSPNLLQIEIVPRLSADVTITHL